MAGIIGITVQRICRWFFHLLLYFKANMEKNIACAPPGFPVWIAAPPCYSGISRANRGRNPPFAELRLNS